LLTGRLFNYSSFASLMVSIASSVMRYRCPCPAVGGLRVHGWYLPRRCSGASRSRRHNIPGSRECRTRQDRSSHFHEREPVSAGDDEVTGEVPRVHGEHPVADLFRVPHRPLDRDERQGSAGHPAYPLLIPECCPMSRTGPCFFFVILILLHARVPGIERKASARQIAIEELPAAPGRAV
jgi:hypothetical protein